MKSIKRNCIAACLVLTGMMVSSCGDSTGTTPDNPTVNNSIIENGATTVQVYDVTPEPVGVNQNATTGTTTEANGMNTIGNTGTNAADTGGGTTGMTGSTTTETTSTTTGSTTGSTNSQ